MGYEFCDYCIDVHEIHEIILPIYDAWKLLEVDSTSINHFAEAVEQTIVDGQNLVADGYGRHWTDYVTCGDIVINYCLELESDINKCILCYNSGVNIGTIKELFFSNLSESVTYWIACEMYSLFECIPAWSEYADSIEYYDLCIVPEEHYNDLEDLLSHFDFSSTDNLAYDIFDSCLDTMERGQYQIGDYSLS